MSYRYISVHIGDISDIGAITVARSLVAQAKASATGQKIIDFLRFFISFPKKYFFLIDIRQLFFPYYHAARPPGPATILSRGRERMVACGLTIHSFITRGSLRGPSMGLCSGIGQ